MLHIFGFICFVYPTFRYFTTEPTFRGNWMKADQSDLLSSFHSFREFMLRQLIYLRRDEKKEERRNNEKETSPFLMASDQLQSGNLGGRELYSQQSKLLPSIDNAPTRKSKPTERKPFFHLIQFPLYSLYFILYKSLYKRLCKTYIHTLQKPILYKRHNDHWSIFSRASTSNIIF